MSRRVIITKHHRIYEIADNDPGTLIEEYFKGAGFELLKPFQGARVYETKNGPVIAIQNPPQPD